MTVHITGAGLARFGKRPEPLEELLEEAARAALELAPSTPEPPEALVVGAMAAGPLAHVESLAPKVAGRLGWPDTDVFHAEAASATGAAAVQLGAALVASARYAHVLVVSGEKMTSLPNPEATEALARSLSPHEVRHGATMPSMASLVSQLYLSRYGVDLADVAEVTVRNRARSVQNPMAHLRTPVTRDEVNSSRMVASPLRLLHVSAISDGAGAVVLAREGRKEDSRILGMGQATDVLEVAARPADPVGFRSTRRAAREAYEEAGISRKEVQVAEVHDAFAPFQLIDLEDLGFCGPGEGLRWTLEGRGDLSGVLPINPSGGLLGRGHPVGASGIAQIVEVDRQLRGDAGPLQAGAPRVGLAQSVGGLGSHNFVTLVGKGA